MTHSDPVLAPREALDSLARALHGVLHPFVAHGSALVPAPVTATLSDGSTLVVAPAADVWTQQSANEPLRGLAATALSFDLDSTPILEEVRHALFAKDSGPLRAELVAFDLHESGGRAEPAIPSCDAVLVLCLPSRFFGGQLVVAQRGAIEVVSWVNDIVSDPDARRVRWAAFSDGVRHHFERVTGGSRLALIYALHRSGKHGEPPLDERAHTEAIRASLRELRPSIEAGARLAVPCEGAYSTIERFIHGPEELEPQDDALLVGRDARLAEAAHAQGLRVLLRPYLVDVREDQLFRLARFIDRARAPAATESRKHILAALSVQGGALSPDRPTTEQFVLERPRFSGVPRRYELDSRTPRALYEGLPALEPAPVSGVVRADSPAAALYVFSALCIERTSAASRSTHEFKPPSKARVEPVKREATPESEPSSSLERSSPAKTRAAVERAEQAKPKRKALPDEPSKRARRAASPAHNKPERKRKVLSSSEAIGGVRRGIAAVLARIERKSKG